MVIGMVKSIYWVYIKGGKGPWRESIIHEGPTTTIKLIPIVIPIIKPNGPLTGVIWTHLHKNRPVWDEFYLLRVKRVNFG